jgi:hypothetical protein
VNAREDEVYQRAIAQFQDSRRGMVRQAGALLSAQKRTADYSALSRKVTGIFSGTDLEEYLSQAPAPDSDACAGGQSLRSRPLPARSDLCSQSADAIQKRVNTQQAAAEKLLWEHWAESPDLRDQLFEAAEQQRAGWMRNWQALRQQAPEIDKADWTTLAQSNPAAERFWLESCLWQSRFEDGRGRSRCAGSRVPGR